MNEERISILRMLEEDKISVDEATALLDAIEQHGTFRSEPYRGTSVGVR